jgi:glycosyltransferase involved in cell wall biosynthesis
VTANGIFIGVLSLFSRDLFRNKPESDQMDISGRKDVRRCCLVNLGLFRTGTTTLAKAAETFGFAVDRKFPCLRHDQHRDFLLRPAEVVRNWWFCQGGYKEVLTRIKTENLICDGWIALLAFLPSEELSKLKEDAGRESTLVHFVATRRAIEETIRSELQHWVVNDLERQTALSFEERGRLECTLRTRAEKHAICLNSLVGLPVAYLRLGQVHEWCMVLSKLIQWPMAPEEESEWKHATEKSGRQNANPPLPIEGIILTFRIGKGDLKMKSLARVVRLLESLEADSLCNYLVVLGIDGDEASTPQAMELEALVSSRQRIQSTHVIVNPEHDNTPVQPFRICEAWHEMAKVAWDAGADWVVLLGDDVTIHCPYHYRAFYAAFLDIQQRLGCPFGFGCPWWNDVSFPGFPTFPVVGKAHYEIFGGLIPEGRVGAFVNQDLDPYLQRIYLSYSASPLLVEATLKNHQGGNETSPARYDRIAAEGWRDWVLEDAIPLGKYLFQHSGSVPEVHVVDIVIPSHRTDLPYLKRLCSLPVPSNMRTCFIVIVDNPDKLVSLIMASETFGALAKEESREAVIDKAALVLEGQLVHASREQNGSENNVRVRCNHHNLGASASRNRGLDESAAEFVLFLDDDVIPEANLLDCYARQLQEDTDKEIAGYVGLVRFPRSVDQPLQHAAVLMSYLTFMFEIAKNPMYKTPAWGVTANLLIRRTAVRFDTDYAKTGGGEDVDFCLRLTNSEETDSSIGACKYLKACPSAVVHHPFWPGSPMALAWHFFNWAIGDSALFSRFPNYTYSSWPNAVEILAVFLPFYILVAGATTSEILGTIGRFILADFTVDVSNSAEERHHRYALLEHQRSTWFLLGAHLLANLYVLVLETGRLWGHMKRGDVQNIGRRFDWHCGRLVQSPTNFRRREQLKFVLFLAIVVGRS